jgi:isopentenyldiphosphate isomerase
MKREKSIMERINNELGIEKEIEIEKKHFYSLQDFLAPQNINIVKIKKFI